MKKHMQSDINVMSWSCVSYGIKILGSNWGCWFRFSL